MIRMANPCSALMLTAKHVCSCPPKSNRPFSSNIAASGSVAFKAQLQGLYDETLVPFQIYTVEDKDASILWRARRDLFDSWFMMLQLAQERWQIINVPMSLAVKKYRIIINAILPRKLMPTNDSMSQKHLSYACFTIKRKCFQNHRQKAQGDLSAPTIPAYPPSSSSPPCQPKALHPGAVPLPVRFSTYEPVG